MTVSSPDPPSSDPRPEPAIGVGAIVFDPEDRVLLIRRGKAPALGLWSVPGGRLERGETLVACCRREVAEETGIEVEPGPIVAVAERIADGFHFVIIDFLADIRGADRPTPIPATDVSDARWVPMGELERYRLVEGLARVIQAAFAVRSGSGRGGLTDPDGNGRDFLHDTTKACER